MKRIIQLLVMLLAACFIHGLATAAIPLGDFSSGNDNWELVGDGNTFKTDAGIERIEKPGVPTALRLNCKPFKQNPDQYRGWVGLQKSWDNKEQHGVTRLSVQCESDHPWAIHLMATFDGVGEKDSGWIFWPKGTVELTAKTYAVTPEQFATIKGIRLTMDTASATNGGGRTSPGAMWVQINKIELDGQGGNEPNVKAQPAKQPADTATRATGGISLGDFLSGEDGWQLVGDGNTFKTDASIERIEKLGVPTALRLNYKPFKQNPDQYRGWVGLQKSWDISEQRGVTKLTVQFESDHPWAIHLLATFDGVGEKDSGWTFWPKGSVEVNAKTYGVTPEQFATIKGVRLLMDAASATNGGGRTVSGPMWIQINKIELDGQGGKKGTSKTETPGKPANTEPTSRVKIDDFDDGDPVGWTLVGDSREVQHYTIKAQPDSATNPFCLRLTQATKAGWSGIGAPSFARLPLKDISTIELDARGNEGAKAIYLDLFVADGSRWGCVVELPRDGSWQHISVTPANFFATENPKNSPACDFSQIKTFWLSLRPDQEWTTKDNPPPATMEIDNVAVIGSPRSSNSASTQGIPAIPVAKPSALPAGMTLLVASTDTLPMLGQDNGAPAAIRHALADMKADIQSVTPGRLGTLAASPQTVLLWEGPACRTGDWEAVEAYLRKGGALVWWGAGLPFSRIVDAEGKVGEPTEVAAKVLSQGEFQTSHPLENDAPWKVSAAGADLWETTSQISIPAAKCRFLTLEDSITLNTHWPWVQVIPLLTIDYKAKNWVWTENSPFTGSVMTVFRHQAGEFAGARVLVATLGASAASPLSPKNPAFAPTLLSAITSVAKPVAVKPELAQLPASSVLTRNNFFSGPVLPKASVQFSHSDLSNKEGGYALHRLGFNNIIVTIPWLETPSANGSVVDWDKLDGIIKTAKSGGWGVVLDGYCFGYARYPWSMEGPDGKKAAPASAHNPRFRELFIKEIRAIASRYAKEPALVAMFATPDTGSSDISFVDSSDVGRAAWETYAAAQGLPADLPKLPEQGKFELTPSRAVYTQFSENAVMGFLRQAIGAIRHEAPDMPIMLRGGFLDVAVSFRLASEFSNVAPYCECVETSVDVESSYRGLAQRYQVPIMAENGWPKARGGPLRMAMATTLMGGYRGYFFSFVGIPFAKPGLFEIEKLNPAWASLWDAKYAPQNTALLIPDTTIWAANPPNFFWAEGQPNINWLMERTGVPFMAVSAQWPKLEGVRFLLDDGRNHVLTAAARQSLVAWIKTGGTLVAYPHTGEFDAAGGASNLAKELGFELKPGEYPLGHGRVVVLAQVPSGKNASQVEVETQFIALLSKLGANAPIQISPAVNQAVFTKTGKTYLVVYNKSKEYVGSFFREHDLPATEAALPNLNLTVTPSFKFTKARDVMSNKELKVEGGVIHLPLPATQFGVIEFELDSK